MSSTGPKDGKVRGGPDVAAEMLRGLDSGARERILANVARQDPKVAAEIQKHLVSMDDLLRVSDPGIQAWIRAVPREKLVISLRRVSEEVRKKIDQNLALRAREELAEEIGSSGPKRLSDIEAAQRAVMDIALELEKQGKLSFAQRGAQRNE